MTYQSVDFWTVIHDPNTTPFKVNDNRDPIDDLSFSEKSTVDLEQNNKGLFANLLPYFF